jgi:acyl carrier protein
MDERISRDEQFVLQVVSDLFLLDQPPSADSRLDSLPGWDSLAFLELVEAIEQRTGVRLMDVDVAGVSTLAQLAAVLEKRRC